jgi:hypothetical protein
MKWELEVSVEEIRKGKMGKTTTEGDEEEEEEGGEVQPASVPFHSSLLSMMAAQSPDDPTSVPLFLTDLLDAIRCSHDGTGLQQEGIFRVSPLKQELDAIKEHLNVVGLAHITPELFPRDNVHLLCALTKEWLRSLKESVVSRNKYQQAIEIAKEEVHRLQQPQQTGGVAITPAGTAALASLLATLPQSIKPCCKC